MLGVKCETQEGTVVSIRIFSVSRRCSIFFANNNFKNPHTHRNGNLEGIFIFGQRNLGLLCSYGVPENKGILPYKSAHQSCRHNSFSKLIYQFGSEERSNYYCAALCTDPIATIPSR